MLKMKMVFLIFNIFFFCSLGLADAGQESIQLFNLYTTTSPEFPEEVSHSGLAVSLSDRDLSEVSGSILKAESWLRAHVLFRYPSTQITTIIVGDTLLCQNHQGQDHTKLSLLLPSLKNVHHSLTRWGLETDIKVSASFSSSCLTNPQSTFFAGDFSHRFTKPILEFLRSKNSTYSVNPPPKFSTLAHEATTIVSSHSDCMKRLGLFGLKTINLILDTNPRETSKLITTRKLTSLSFPILADPFPTRPNPLPKTSDPPLHSSVGFSVPSNIAKHPQPPQAQIASPPENGIALSPQSAQTAPPPPNALPFASSPPQMPPLLEPSSPPYGLALPPCNPSPSPLAAHHPGAPMPVTVHGLWCVAKPSVPADTLQAAIDYACGDGGADCDEIAPSGSCYNPDTVVAHASYAFNSYWQKHKRNGGTCSFGGTAMLINNDPSFLHCRFVLA